VCLRTRFFDRKEAERGGRGAISQHKATLTGEAAASKKGEDACHYLDKRKKKGREERHIYIILN